MGFPKITKTVLVLVALSMVHASLAQNSPQDFLDAHNEARAQAGVEPLIWDDNVAAYAQNYANERSGDCAMIHSDTSYGENLAAGFPDITAKGAVGMWVEEISLYDYNSNTCVGGECRHYTQVVWSSSERLGCARVGCNNGWWFITCNYDPPGNIEGDRPYLTSI